MEVIALTASDSHIFKKISISIFIDSGFGTTSFQLDEQSTTSMLNNFNLIFIPPHIRY